MSGLNATLLHGLHTVLCRVCAYRLFLYVLRAIAMCWFNDSGCTVNSELSKCIMSMNESGDCCRSCSSMVLVSVKRVRTVNQPVPCNVNQGLMGCGVA